MVHYLLLLSTLVSLQAFATDSNFFTTEPPEGFEDLFEPQTTVIDVFYAGQLIGQTLATYSPDFFQFDQLPQLLTLLPKIKHPQKISQALTGQLPTNNHLACIDKLQKNCGQLKPNIAGIIFDEAKFQVHIFIHPDYLPVQSTINQKYLPLPKTEFSAIQLLNANLAITESAQITETSTTINSRSIFAYQNKRLFLDFTTDSEQDIQLDNLFAEMDQSKQRYKTGLFDRQTLNFIEQQQLLGFSLQSQTDTRRDIEQLRASQILVFLPRNSRIEVFQQNKLIAVQHYLAGKHLLDVRNFPDGAYHIRLKIRDTAGNVSEETHFFIKTDSIPPKDQPFYIAELGLITEQTTNTSFPKITEALWLRLGRLQRFNQHFAFGGDLIWQDDTALLELKSFGIFQHFTTRAGSLLSNRKQSALELDFTGNYQQFGYGINFRKDWLLDNTQIKINGSYNFPKLSLRWLMQWNQTQQQSNYILGPQFSWNLWKTHQAQLQLQGDISKTQDDLNANIQLQLSWRFGSHTLQHKQGLHYFKPSNPPLKSTEHTQGLNLYWQKNQWLQSDWNLNLGWENGISAESLYMDTLVQGHKGRLGFRAERIKNTQNIQHRYNASLNLGTAITPQHLAIGGKNSYVSAVIIEVIGNVQAEFKLLINNQQQDTILTNQSVPVFLSPYKTYQIRLLPIHAPIIKFDANIREVTLYPGNVSTLVWTVENIVVLFGRIIDKQQQAIINTEIKGSGSFATTDDQGYFQIEVSSPTTLKLQSSSQDSCEIEITPQQLTKIYQDLGELICQ